MSDPLGTYTFVFTDVEGSTRLWEAQPDEMQEAVRLHDRLLRGVFEGRGGRIFKTLGDAFCVAFDAPGPAISAAIDAVELLGESDTKPTLAIRVGIHTGTAESRDNDYFGPTLSRVARVMASGHGGQVLVTGATYELVRDDLPLGAGVIDLGLHRLRDLTRPEQIYQLRHPGLKEHFPPLRTLDSRPNNLPIQGSRFVGRERELKEIQEGVRASRLVTVVGPGGVGKTRATLQAAADLEDQFADGVWLVELAGLNDATRIPWAVTEALSIREQQGVPLMDTLKAYLDDHHLLLVLDNCEHVVAAAAALVVELLRTSVNLRILASSREPLSVGGERVYRLPSLEIVPATSQDLSPATLEQFEAVQLFIDRALLVHPSFRVDNENAAAVAGICARLDGIPLAIELAAARLRSLSVKEIHQRLDNAFRLLTMGSRDVSARQQTLRGAIDWSYDLLEDRERTALHRLSVFRGSWPLEAAEGVVADDEIESWEVLDLMTSLVDKSLVMVDHQGSETWYRLLETIRQYATEKLGSDELATRDRHLAYYRAEAEKAARAGQVTGEVTGRLFRQSEEIRAALAWCLSKPGSGPGSLSFANDLHRAVLIRWSFAEAAAVWEQVLKEGDLIPPDKNLVTAYGHASWYAGRIMNLERARYWAEKGAAIADQVGDALAKGRTLNALGSLAFQLERFDEAESYTREALRVVSSSNSYQADVALNGNLGSYLLAMGRTDEAREAFLRAAERAEQANDPMGRALLARYLGDVAADRLEFEEATRLLEAGYRVADEISMDLYLANYLTDLYAYLPFVIERNREAAELSRSRLQEGIRLAAKVGSARDEYIGRAHLIEVCSFLCEFEDARHQISRLPHIRASGMERSVLFRSCAWLALAAGLPEASRALAVAARTERVKSRTAVTRLEELLADRLDRALEGVEGTVSSLLPDEVVAQLQASAGK